MEALERGSCQAKEVLLVDLGELVCCVLVPQCPAKCLLFSRDSAEKGGKRVRYEVENISESRKDFWDYRNVQRLKEGSHREGDFVLT